MVREGLNVSDVSIDRSGNRVVRDVSLRCPPGEITVLLGANGAGKSSLLDGIAGAIPLRAGTVTVDGVDVSRPGPFRSGRPGLAYVEQGRTVFSDLTVAENLRAVSADDETTARALDLFPELERRMEVPTGLLSGGEQQMVVLARAICTNPDVILIDEMSQGLAPVVVRRLFPVLRTIADAGTSVLLVEQFANLALHAGDRAYVMYVGAITLEASCAELIAQPQLVQDAYLRGR